MSISVPRALWALPLVTVLSACGGGGAADGLDIEASVATPAAAETSDLRLATSRSSALATVSTSQRTAAAKATADSASNACAPVRPFYWEVGNADGRLASGSAGVLANGSAIGAQTPMAYASASKWLYAAYVAEVRGGRLNSNDVQMLTFRSGYTNFSSCQPGQTVDACLATGTNGDYDAATDGIFVYNGGHMEKHASLNGLGAMDNAGLAAALQSRLGSKVSVGFLQPQLAGGGYGTPQTYARFLRRLVGGKLELSRLLGHNSVCADPDQCGRDVAMRSPAPVDESWRYSLGHWVESDPLVGDGAFSSPGALGFYPWIDASGSQYGLVARSVKAPRAGRDSAYCGRLIRKAWALGAAQ